MEVSTSGTFTGRARRVEGNGNGLTLYDFESRGDFPTAATSSTGASARGSLLARPRPRRINGWYGYTWQQTRPAARVLVGTARSSRRAICSTRSRPAWRAPIDRETSGRCGRGRGADGHGSGGGTDSEVMGRPQVRYVFNAANGLREGRSPNMGTAGGRPLRIAQGTTTPPGDPVRSKAADVASKEGTPSSPCWTTRTPFEIKNATPAARGRGGKEDGTLRALKAARGAGRRDRAVRGEHRGWVADCCRGIPLRFAWTPSSPSRGATAGGLAKRELGGRLGERTAGSWQTSN